MRNEILSVVLNVVLKEGGGEEGRGTRDEGRKRTLESGKMKDLR